MDKKMNKEKMKLGLLSDITQVTFIIIIIEN